MSETGTSFSLIILYRSITPLFLAGAQWLYGVQWIVIKLGLIKGGRSGKKMINQNFLVGVPVEIVFNN